MKENIIGYVCFGEINTPICVGGILVYPGDIVVGDQDGVVVIRPEDAPQIAAAARGDLLLQLLDLAFLYMCGKVIFVS